MTAHCYQGRKGAKNWHTHTSGVLNFSAFCVPRLLRYKIFARCFDSESCRFSFLLQCPSQLDDTYSVDVSFQEKMMFKFNSALVSIDTKHRKVERIAGLLLEICDGAVKDAKLKSVK